MVDTLYLRLLREDDFAFIYNLYCEKSQIYWSGHSEEPKEESLLKWFNNLLMDPHVVPYIISNGSERVGFCRLKIHVNNKEICEGFPFSISERFRNRGYATKAISLLINEARFKFGIRYMYDWVLDTNEASKKVFLRNGFRQTGRTREQFIPLEGKNILMHEYILDVRMGAIEQ